MAGPSSVPPRSFLALACILGYEGLVMMPPRFTSMLAAIALPALLAFAVSAGEAGADDEPIKVIDEHKIYRTINGEAILGREVMDLVLEDHWDTQLQGFIEHVLRTDEIAAAGIVVSREEIDSELQNLLLAQAKRYGVDPKDLKIDDIVKKGGVVGGPEALKRSVGENVGVLRVLQKEGKLPAKTTIADRSFQEAMRERLEKRIAEKGVVTDPKRLGGGEACRIGARGFSRDEVRAFIVEMLRSMPLSQLKYHLSVLSLERAVVAELKKHNLELKQEDRDFHWYYLCNLYERETGLPGRIVISQEIQKIGKTPEQFLAGRVFKSDACITMLAKQPLREKQLREEFAAHPERYKRNENMIAHMIIRVLDPEGRPYTNNWRAPGHDAVNTYVAKMREQQFSAAKPKIENFVAAAKADWEDTVKRASEDTVSAKVGGKIGRVGAQTILFPPCDKNIRDAALKLKPGEVSEPVRSDFGWHLVKCLEKQDVTYDEAAVSVYLNLLQEARRAISGTLEKEMKVEDKID